MEISPAFVLAGSALLALIPASSPAAALLFAGDFLPGASAEKTISEKGYDYLFEGIRGILEGSEGLILNLETPLSTRERPVEGKTFTFRCSPEVAAGMTRAKVAAVTLANNHILDQGPEALMDTLLALDRAGIAHAGAGEDLARALAPAVLSLPSGSVRILAFSNTFPEDFWAGKETPGTAFGDLAVMTRAVAETAKMGPVIVTFHWGEEMMETPKPYQRELAHAAIDAGAAAVIGHHPHVPQPLEIYHGRPILYSLGNFSFGSNSRKIRHGLLARLTLGPGGEWENLEIFPLLVANEEVAYQPRIVDGEEGRAVFAGLTSLVPPGAALVRWEGDRGVLSPAAY